jgi:hypothetical protein
MKNVRSPWMFDVPEKRAFSATGAREPFLPPRTTEAADISENLD